MKLAAIYNVWDSTELLRGSMLQMQYRVDVFIIVFQNISNYGEHYSPLSDMDLTGFNYVLRFYSPDLSKPGFYNETTKRNIGLKAAKELNCTHFLMCDNDEYYENFPKAVDEYCAAGIQGSVCRLFTYFKLPTWRFEKEDNYYVPFIHKLNRDTYSGSPEYPYYVDPTRRINCTDVALINEPMHHFSYVRKNIDRKCRNSSARDNIAKSKLLADYNDPNCGPGFYVEDFRQYLIEVKNIFGIEI